MSSDFNALLIQFQERFLNPATTIGAILWAIIAGFIAWLIGRALKLTVQRVLSRPRHIPADQTAIRFLAQLARLGVYLFAFLTYAQFVPPLRSLGNAWLASVGVASVVLGLAAQNTLGNLIAGISLLLYRPFNIGDRLQVTSPTGLESGVVESLNLGYTILRTADDRRIVIPNSAMASQTSVNLSLTDPRTVCLVPINLHADSDVEKVRAILTELARQHPKTLEFAACPVTGLGNFNVTVTLKLWCQDPKTALDIKNDILDAAQKRFRAEGIKWR